MPQSDAPDIAAVVIDVLQQASRESIDPILGSHRVADDLGLDSLQLLNVFAELEDRLDVSIPLNDLAATRTVADLIAQVLTTVDGGRGISSRFDLT